MRCSVCNKEVEFAFRVTQDAKTGEWHCEHDSPNIGSIDKLANLRKENRTQTAEARKMAMHAMAEKQQENPDIMLAPVDNARPMGNAPIAVPKSVLDSLNKKRPEGYA
jgi:hypothetical protein